MEKVVPGYKADNVINFNSENMLVAVLETKRVKLLTKTDEKHHRLVRIRQWLEIDDKYEGEWGHNSDYWNDEGAKGLARDPVDTSEGEKKN